MIRSVVMVATSRLNYFPVKGGASSCFGPRVTMSMGDLECKRDFSIPFGSCVQANCEPRKTNAQVPRAFDAVCLRPSAKGQGHEVMDLNSGKLRVCRKVTRFPVTDVVVKAVEKMAEDQGFKELKFKNHHGVTIHDAD